MNKLFWKNLMRFEFFLVFFLVFLPGTQGNSNCPLPPPAEDIVGPDPRSGANKDSALI